jgi:hypothetical protein
MPGGELERDHILLGIAMVLAQLPDSVTEGAWIVAILVFVSITIWKIASDRKMDIPTRMAGYAYAAYFLILGGIALWSNGDFLRISRMLFIGGASLVVFGLGAVRFCPADLAEWIKQELEQSNQVRNGSNKGSGMNYGT